MGTALLKIKLMPTSLEVDLEVIKENAKKEIEKNKGTKVKTEEQPVAFGLKAIIVSFDLSEEFELDPIESALENLENVSSAQVIDMRRAIE